MFILYIKSHIAPRKPDWQSKGEADLSYFASLALPVLIFLFSLPNGTDFPDECKAENEDLKGTTRPSHLPFFVKEEELSGDELEELIKDRYGRSSKYVVHAEDSKESGDEVSAADLMKDPTVWKIKCMVCCSLFKLSYFV